MKELEKHIKKDKKERESFLEQIREDALKTFTGKELNNVLEEIKKLEEADKSLEMALSSKMQEPIREREQDGFISSLKDYFAYKTGSKHQKEAIRNKHYQKTIEEDKLIDKVQNNLKDPKFQNEVKLNFKKRLYLFRFSVILLIISAIITVTIFNRYDIPDGFIGFMVVAVFLGIYVFLGKIFWRCPACGYKMDFLKRYNGKGANRSSITKCPRCFALFK